jgi:UDP-2,3-diacylglucosamine pyrophosphatase LpxH
MTPQIPVEDDVAPAMRFRAIFISDIHLGTPGCQAGRLLDFLRHTESDELYLVGDIIDGWQLRRRWFWHQDHNDVVQKVLRKARKGTRVTYIAGNHDEAARQFIGLSFGGIDIVDEAIHQTRDGRILLVTHGDLFDAVVQGARWLAHLGDAAYILALQLNRWSNHVRARLGLPYWSLSQFLKHRVKNAVAYIANFEEALAQEARRRGFAGVVCGHIHKAEIRDVGGILYCNDGDWVESLTALVETEQGELRIIDWKSIEALKRGAMLGSGAPPADGRMPVPKGAGNAYSPGD